MKGPAKLRHVASVQKGRQTPNLEPPEGMPLISMEYLRGEVDAPDYVDPKGGLAVREGETLILWDGSNAGEIMRSRNGILGSTLGVVRPRGIEAGFLYWVCKANERRIKSETIGMGIPHVNGDMLGDLAIPLFDSAAQQTITDHLERATMRIDALIAQKERLLALLEEKRLAVVSHFVTKGLDSKARTKGSGQWWIGRIPSHWEILKVKHVAKVESGHTPSKTVPEYWENCNVPWVSLQDSTYLRTHDYIDETAQNISELGMANSSAHLLPRESVVFSRDATVGLCAITRRPMAVSQHFIAWVCGPRIIPKYLLYVLHAMRPELNRLTMGSTIVTIGMPEIRDLVTPLPPVAEQTKIVEQIDQVRDRLRTAAEAVEHSLALLRERRQSLITAAVTGQLDPSVYMPKQETIAA